MTTETDYIGVMIRYEGIGKSVPPDAVAGQKVQPTKVTGQAQVAATWTDGCTSANAISAQNGQLEPGHFYALAYAYVQSASAIAVAESRVARLLFLVAW